MFKVNYYLSCVNCTKPNKIATTKLFYSLNTYYDIFKKITWWT